MKKRGKKIRQNLVLQPLGVKTTRYEILARCSLVALQTGHATHEHLVNLYVLADLCDALSDELYITRHCDAVKRLCQQIDTDAYVCADLTYQSMEASANLLLGWFHAQDNMRIARAALKVVDKIERKNGI